jgi:hypothetical protein
MKIHFLSSKAMSTEDAQHDKEHERGDKKHHVDDDDEDDDDNDSDDTLSSNAANADDDDDDEIANVDENDVAVWKQRFEKQVNQDEIFNMFTTPLLFFLFPFFFFFFFFFF